MPACGGDACRGESGTTSDCKRQSASDKHGHEAGHVTRRVGTVCAGKGEKYFKNDVEVAAPGIGDGGAAERVKGGGGGVAGGSPPLAITLLSPILRRTKNGGERKAEGPTQAQRRKKKKATV